MRDAAVHVMTAATALLGMVLLARGALAAWPAAVRSVLFRSAVAALLVLPVAYLGLPRWHVPGWTEREPAGAAEVRVRVPGAAAGVVAAGPLVQADAAVRPVPPGEAGRHGRLTVVGLLGVVWAAGALLLLVRHAHGALAVARTLSRSRVVRDARVRGAAWRAGRAVGLRGPVRVLECDDLGGPAACGGRRPAVLLPPGHRTWPDDTLRTVLLHESAHLRRRDPLFLSMGALARALYWPHPGVWWLARGMAREAEQACDEVVIAAGADPARYAADLVRLARASFAAGSAPLVAMASAGTLERRVRRLLSGRPVTPPRRFDGIAAAGIPLVLALLLGAAAPASPGAPQRQAMPEPPASPGAAALPSPVPARLEGPIRVGWRRSGSRFEAEVLGTFEITAQGRLVAGTPDAVLRVWRRRPDGSERLYVAGAAPGGIRLAVGWTGDASLAPGAGESALWSDFILPDLVAAASRGARVDTVTSAERERALRALRASGGEGSIGRDRAAFTARVRHALTAVLPPRLRAHDVIIADIALELWTELHVTILWPARDGGSHGPIGIQGNAHLTVIHGESEELIAEVSTRGGPLSRRLPLVAQRRFGAAGLPLDPALLPSLERAGSEITADWESHYQRRRDGQ